MCDVVDAFDGFIKGVRADDVLDDGMLELILVLGEAGNPSFRFVGAAGRTAYAIALLEELERDPGSDEPERGDEQR